MDPNPATQAPRAGEDAATAQAAPPDGPASAPPTLPHAVVLSGADDAAATVVAPAPARTAPAPVAAVPGYEILGELGRGGMGVVYKARHVRLNRVVALKMILGGRASGADLQRFQTEAQAVAALHHPNIVQVYEIGEWRASEAEPALPFMALEFVEGGTLSRKLKSLAPTPREAAQLVETLAKATHHAHERGIIHRDLKPGNVLLTNDGIPKISDFGIAKNLRPQDGEAAALAMTQTGDILGTPRYMAPEQAKGDIRRIGPATDVHALGVILYEMLAGQAPFDGETAMGTLQRVLNDDPLPPSRRQDHVPRDLDTICLTCLEKNPERRYASAQALADDLRAFLAGDTIQARPPNARERVLRWAQRRPTLAALAAVGAVALAGALVGAFLHSVFAFGGVAVLSLLLAAWWYNTSLQSALAELARQNREAQHHVERLHFLLEITRRLMSAANADQVLAILGDATTRLVDAERATIFVVDRDRGELWSRVATGEGMGEIRVPLSSGIAGHVARTGEALTLHDPYSDPRFNQEIDRQTGFRTRNLLTVPVKAINGSVIGVFQVLNKRQGTFEPEDVKLLQALAASAAPALHSVP